MGMVFGQSIFLDLSMSLLAHVGEKALYGFIWKHPKVARRFLIEIFGPHEDPCSTLHKSLVLGKLLQFAPMALAFRKYGTYPEISALNALLLMVAIAGQYLNFTAYKALGMEGIYYGTKFGKKITSCETFPYNSNWLSHPQYVGASATMLATFLMCFAGVDIDAKAYYLTGTIATYAYISYIEQYC